jgi:hypothetical protein
VSAVFSLGSLGCIALGDHQSAPGSAVPHQETVRHPDLSIWLADSANPARAEAVPSVGERRAMAQGVLAVLHENISKGKLNYRFNPSGEGVVIGTAGLAFIATGSNLGGGPYKDSLSAIYKRIKSIMDAGEFPLQPVWGATQSLVFLTELHRTSPPRNRPEIASYIAKYAKRIQDSQTAEGSWCHTFEDKPNSLGYRGLVATSVMALQGLGNAKREGVPVDQKVIDKAVAYLVASSNVGKGFIGYSNRGGQKGMKGPGRTAGGLLAFWPVDRISTNSPPTPADICARSSPTIPSARGRRAPCRPVTAVPRWVSAGQPGMRPPPVPTMNSGRDRAASLRLVAWLTAASPLHRQMARPHPGPRRSVTLPTPGML